MEEREINLADLLVEILLHWRGILVLMAISGIFMGVFSYARSSRSVEEQEQSPNVSVVNREEYVEYLRSQLTEAELAKVYSVICNEELYDEMKAYMEQSALMQIDSLNVPRIDLVYVVTAEKEKPDQDIGKVYRALANSTGFYEWLAEENGMSSAAVSELISVNMNKSHMESNNPYVSLEGIFASGNTLKITVIHYDREACEALAQSVADYIDQQYGKLKEIVGEHEVTLLDHTFSVVADESLMNLQISQRDTFVSLADSTDKAKTEFSSSQKQYYDFLRESEAGANSVGQPTEVSEVVPSVSIKYVVLGMILAAFIYAFVIFMQYIFNGKLRRTDDLGEIYGVSLLGLIPEGDKKKKIFSQVDEKILMLRDRNKRKFTVEEAMELAATAVKIAAEKNPTQSVCLIGCDLKSGSMKVCEKIKEKLEQSDITVKILDNILYDAGALEQLNDVGGAVLVERAGSTLYAEIARELELLGRQEVKVLGGIIC